MFHDIHRNILFNFTGRLPFVCCLVYYLYPTRTLIRVPFMIGAVFYTIALQSVVIYQLEMVIKAVTSELENSPFCLPCDYKTDSAVEDDDTTPPVPPNSYGIQADEQRPEVVNNKIEPTDSVEDDDTTPLVHGATPNSYGIQTDEQWPEVVINNEIETMNTCQHSFFCNLLCECISCVDKEYIKEQDRLSSEYYREQIKKDLKFLSHNFSSAQQSRIRARFSRCLYMIISMARLVTGIIILVAFLYGEIILANLVFNRTNNTDINSLLALLPTIIFSIFAWFGRSLIFDVREDVKDLNIPYFKKKESTEEKILNAINELVELQRSRINHEQEGQKNTMAAKATPRDGGQGQSRNSVDAVDHDHSREKTMATEDA